MDPKSALEMESTEKAFNDYCANHHDQLAQITEENRLLRNENKALKEDLVKAEEEPVMNESRSKTTIDNLHSNQDHLERMLKAAELKVSDKETEVNALKNENEKKDGIIKSINTGLNQKIRELTVKIKDMSKEALKKEKKVKKKERQRAKKETNKSVVEDPGSSNTASENNNIEMVRDGFKKKKKS